MWRGHRSTLVKPVSRLPAAAGVVGNGAEHTVGESVAIVIDPCIATRRGNIDVTAEIRVRRQLFVEIHCADGYHTAVGGGKAGRGARFIARSGDDDHPLVTHIGVLVLLGLRGAAATQAEIDDVGDIVVRSNVMPELLLSPAAYRIAWIMSALVPPF